jgi:hypothetical protein
MGHLVRTLETCIHDFRSGHALVASSRHVRFAPRVHRSSPKDSMSRLDGQGQCSFFVLMAHEPIDTLGKATRHNMLVKVECSCGNVRYCRSSDLMMVYGGGVDPLKLKFDCSRCKPQIKITVIEVHPEHLPKRLLIHKPVRVGRKIEWHTERFKG